MENINWKSKYLSFRLKNEQLANLPNKIIDVNLSYAFDWKLPEFILPINFSTLYVELINGRNNGGIYVCGTSPHNIQKFCNYCIANTKTASYTIKDWRKLSEEILKSKKTFYSNYYLIDILFNHKKQDLVLITRDIISSEINQDFYPIKDLFISSILKHLL